MDRTNFNGIVDTGFGLTDGVGGGSSVTHNTPVSVSTTEQQILELHKTVSEMDKLIGILHDRLNPVLREAEVPLESNSEEESLPPLANAIRQSRYLAQICISKLNDILNRLDI